MIKSQQNIEHSRFQLLLNHAKNNNEDFNLLLIRCAIERFLYRLSISKYKKEFILKGASLFLIWGGKNFRVTRDIDFLGQGNSDTNTLKKSFQEICKVSLEENDAITFDPDSVKVQPIRKNIQYGGTRITVMAILHNAKIPLQIDVGFGDAVTPAPENVDSPPSSSRSIENLPVMFYLPGSCKRTITFSCQGEASGIIYIRLFV
jgi:hypothetical protein